MGGWGECVSVVCFENCFFRMELLFKGLCVNFLVYVFIIFLYENIYFFFILLYSSVVLIFVLKEKILGFVIILYFLNLDELFRFFMVEFFSLF